MSQWRTVIVCLAGMFALLLGLGLVAWKSDASVSYSAFATGIGICVGAVAAKAYGQHRENARNAAEPPK